MRRSLWQLLALLALVAAATAACNAAGGPRNDVVTDAPSPVATAHENAPARSAARPVEAPATELPPAGSAWVAITDQRSDVLTLTAAQARAMLLGTIEDWAAAGGRARPVRPFVATEDLAAIAAALDLDAAAIAAAPVSHGAIVDRVAATPGGFALVRPEQLRPGVLALIVDGYDPYSDHSDGSPLAGPGQTAGGGIDPVLVAVTGELIPARCTNLALETLEDDDAMFDGVRELFSAADLTIVPLETSLTDRGAPTPCLVTFVLQGRAEIASAIARAGVDVVLPIGNHITDCWDECDGSLALADTLDYLHAAGVATAGAGVDRDAATRPATVEAGTGADAVTFAILGFDAIAEWNAAAEHSPGVAALDLAVLADQIRAGRAVADHVIVGINWGVEYTADPTPAQREAAAIAIDAGATLVFGNHPHWVQAIDQPQAALIAYALGNLVFDQSWSVETTQSVILEASFDRTRLIGYRLRPLAIRGLPEVSAALYRPELVAPAGEGAAILERIWAATDRLASPGPPAAP